MLCIDYVGKQGSLKKNAKNVIANNRNEAAQSFETDNKGRRIGDCITPRVYQTQEKKIETYV